MEITIEDLRALLFWAKVGVEHSRGGSYEEYVIDTLVRISHEKKFPLEGYPVWGKDIAHENTRICEELDRLLDEVAPTHADQNGYECAIEDVRAFVKRNENQATKKEEN